MLAKARELPADEVVLDLEDAVAPSEKDAARAALAQELRAGFGDRAVTVRVNGAGTPWLERDIALLAETAAVGARLDCLTIPKAESSADVALVAGLLESAGGEAAARVGLEALIETAAGLVAAAEIATASPRLQALIIGYADLGASLGMPSEDPDPVIDRWHFARATVLVAARAAGLQAIDGPFLGIDDPAGLAREAGRAQALGYDGKWAIHPSQLEALNARFTPSAGELERAREVLDALARSPDGATRLDGEMIDEASRRHAERVLARAGRPAPAT